MIFCANPSAQFKTYQSEIEAAVLKVMRSDQYVLGEEVDSLEQEFASYIGVSHAIGVADGTDALELSMHALDIKPGDEVITVSNINAHIAGALGIPCTVLLPMNCHWRWGRQGESCPWYQSVRLLRQIEPGSWDAPLEKLKQSFESRP